jgi:hypothetical protein
MESKVTEELLEALERSDASEMLDVVIELRPENEPKTRQPQSRAEKIAVLKENFIRDLAPVEEAVRDAGGELTGQAWINRTVRARVPTECVKKLSEQEQVAKVDVPHAIEQD